MYWIIAMQMIISRFKTKPEVIYDGYGQPGKNTARGKEQWTFEHFGGLEGTAINKILSGGIILIEALIWTLLTNIHLKFQL